MGRVGVGWGGLGRLGGLRLDGVILKTKYSRLKEGGKDGVEITGEGRGPEGFKKK